MPEKHRNETLLFFAVCGVFHGIPHVLTRTTLTWSGLFLLETARLMTDAFIKEIKKIKDVTFFPYETPNSATERDVRLRAHQYSASPDGDT